MSKTSLQDALHDCLISFDNRVLVTDLLEEYKLTYKEVNVILMAHIEQEEKAGITFEKRFLVHGKEQQTANEIFTIVEGEAKQQEWLLKLKNAESSLYSVEVSGGAKSPAQIFKPMQNCEVQMRSVELRENAKSFENGSAEAASSDKTSVKSESKTPIATVTTSPVKPSVKTESKTPFATVAAVPSRKEGDGQPHSSETKKTKMDANQPTTKSKKSPPETKKSPPETKKSSPETKISPSDVKSSTKTIAKKGKGSINNFFTASANKTDEKKEVKTIKPPSPKKMEDFFKKQTEKPETKPKEVKQETLNNVSVQLFDETQEIESSSDEEEKLDTLRRDITSDNEAESKTGSKRRRILESDDEEDQPQQKLEKVDVVEMEVDTVVETEVKSETYLDDDGFVITVKSKKSNQISDKKKSSPPAATATSVKKTPVKAAAKPSTKAALPATKTKQGNIMSFFNKK